MQQVVHTSILVAAITGHIRHHIGVAVVTPALPQMGTPDVVIDQGSSYVKI